jgi:hypothetical protein
MHEFTVSLKGRVKNFPLPKDRPLIPLYEAVVNSIHAIDERRIEGEPFQGLIKISVLRSKQVALEPETTISSVVGFAIEDNGIGFNEANIRSFLESDSEYKAASGGKGVGRFSWLKALTSVNITSTFREENEYHTREFDFSLESPRIDDSLITADKEDYSTTIQLNDYRKEYEKYVPKQLGTLAQRIIQHCLVYLLDEQCPTISLVDGDKQITLNELFRTKFKTDASQACFDLNNEHFDLLHVKIEERSFPANKLYLCANNRLVESVDLDKIIVDLDSHFFDENSFLYIGVLTSSYFDRNVEMARLSFNIPENAVRKLYSKVQV